jgi:methylated-DNA-[protein]-cysteine S-methyltransferase
MAMAQSTLGPKTNVSAYRLFDTAIGVCGVAWTREGLIRVQLPERDEAMTERRLRAKAGLRCDADPPRDIANCIALLQRYFAGEPIDFRDVALDFSGVIPFNADVYRALREIGWQRTTTYGELAKRIGDPGAARAVGAAMAQNPWPIVVPCHRVLAAAKKLGGFSAPGGAATKLKLLRLEGAEIDSGTPLFPDHVGRAK